MQHNQGPADEPRRPSLKSWWQALTFRRDSRAPSSTPTQATAYQPRHAARDAMLSIPLAERKFRPPSKEQPRAVKRHSCALSEKSAVHPNRELSMERLRSFNRRSYSWSPLAGGSTGVGMERIGEDEPLDTSDAAAAHVTNGGGSAEAKDEGQVQKTSRLHPFHAHAQNKTSTPSASTSPTPTANGPASSESTRSTNPTSPPGTTSPSPKPSNASIHEARIRQQRESQQAANRLLVQQLHKRLGSSGNAGDATASATTATQGMRRRPITVRRATTCVSYPAAAAKYAGPPQTAGAAARPLSMVQAGPSAEGGAGATYTGKGKAAATYGWEPPAKRLSSMLCPDQGITNAAPAQSSEASLSPRSSRTSQEAEEAEVETVKAVKIDTAPAEVSRVKWIDQQSSEESLSPRSTRTSAEREQTDSSRTSAEEEAEVETVKAVGVGSSPSPSAAAVGENPGENAEVLPGCADQQTDDSIAGSAKDEQQTGEGEEEEEELSVDDWITRMTDGAFYREGAW